MLKNIGKFILWFYPVGALLIILIYLILALSYPVRLFINNITKNDIKRDFIFLLYELSLKHYYKTLKGRW